MLKTFSCVRWLAIGAIATLIGMTGAARSFADIREFTETVNFTNVTLSQNNFIQWNIVGDGNGVFQPDAKLESVTVDLTLISSTNFMPVRDFAIFFSPTQPAVGASLGPGTWQFGGTSGGGLGPQFYDYGASNRRFWADGPSNRLVQTFTAAQLSSSDISLAGFNVWYGAASGPFFGSMVVSGQASFTYSAVPEPGSMALAGIGAIAFGSVVVRRRIKQKAAKS